MSSCVVSIAEEALSSLLFYSLLPPSSPPPPPHAGISTSCLFQALHYFPIFKIPFKQQENVLKFYTENGKRKQPLLLWLANCFFNSKFTYLSYYWRYWPWQSQYSTQQGAPCFIICSADSLIITGIWWRLKWRDWIPWWMSLQGIKMIQTDDEQDIFHKGIKILSLHFICSQSIFSFFWIFLAQSLCIWL